MHEQEQHQRDADRDELGAWLRLALTPQVGLDTTRRLLTAFGSPERGRLRRRAGRLEALPGARQ